MMHVLASQDARRAKGVSRSIGWLSCLIVFGAGCSGCYQSTFVPPTASISQSIRPTSVSPETIEPMSPPSTHQMEPITANNPWKPDVESRDWKFIVLHHTASESGNVETIHQEHLTRKDKNGNSWLGIGYHFVIGNGKGMEDGEIESTFRWRQQLQGAHAGVAEYNQHGIGIVLIGNFENSAPTVAQIASIKHLVGVLKREYGIASNKVLGHGDVKPTDCPGKLFPINEIRDSIALKDGHAAIETSPNNTMTSGDWLRQDIRSTKVIRDGNINASRFSRHSDNTVTWINLPGDSRK